MGAPAAEPARQRDDKNIKLVAARDTDGRVTSPTAGSTGNAWCAKTFARRLARPHDVARRLAGGCIRFARQVLDISVRGAARLPRFTMRPQKPEHRVDPVGLTLE